MGASCQPAAACVGDVHALAVFATRIPATLRTVCDDEGVAPRAPVAPRARA
jgi:hypothetical protein